MNYNLGADILRHPKTMRTSLVRHSRGLKPKRTAIFPVKFASTWVKSASRDRMPSHLIMLVIVKLSIYNYQFPPGGTAQPTPMSLLQLCHSAAIVAGYTAHSIAPACKVRGGTAESEGWRNRQASRTNNCIIPSSEPMTT